MQQRGFFANLLVSAVAVVFVVFSLGGSGCNSDSDRQVTITYGSTFNGETPQGYLNLVIDMYIRNSGYQTLDVSPSDIVVKVGDYSYRAEDSQGQTSILSDGEESHATLIYQVPPEAATPRVGFSLAYSGAGNYNVKWVKDSNRVVDIEASEPAIKIAYTTRLMWVASTIPGIEYLEVGDKGQLFLVTEMWIENKGYESFSTDKDFFSVEASNALNSVVSKVQGELIDWRELEIQNNGSYIGTLLFPIPTDAAQSFYKWEYKMMYSGLRTYDIEWTKLEVNTCSFDPSITKLDTIDLPDGESIKGEIAFIVPQMIAEKAIYRLQYSRQKSSHNVQFFNREGSVFDINRNPIAYPAIKVTYTTTVENEEETGRSYLVADVLIENQGSEAFSTAPVNFYLEIIY